jgi:hypothetical protein
MSRLSDENVVTNVSLNSSTPNRVLARLIRQHDGVDGTDAEVRIHPRTSCGRSTGDGGMKRFVVLTYDAAARSATVRVSGLRHSLERRVVVGRYGG